MRRSLVFKETLDEEKVYLKLTQKVYELLCKNPRMIHLVGQKEVIVVSPV